MTIKGILGVILVTGFVIIAFYIFSGLGRALNDTLNFSNSTPVPNEEVLFPLPTK